MTFMPMIDDEPNFVDIGKIRNKGISDVDQSASTSVEDCDQ